MSKLRFATRVRLWLTAPWRCKVGRHVYDEGYWSYGFGMLNFHCRRCEKVIGGRAMDDTSEEEQARVRRVKEDIFRRIETEGLSGHL